MERRVRWGHAPCFAESSQGFGTVKQRSCILVGEQDAAVPHSPPFPEGNRCGARSCREPLSKNTTRPESPDCRGAAACSHPGSIVTVQAHMSLPCMCNAQPPLEENERARTGLSNATAWHKMGRIAL